LGWLLSLVLHALLVIVLGYFAGQPWRGTRHAPFDSVIGGSAGVLLADFSGALVDDEYFQDEQSDGTAGTDSSSDSGVSERDDAPSATAASLAAIAAGPPPVDALAALPASGLATWAGGELAATISGQAGSGATGVGGLLHGPRQAGKSYGKFARTHVYGVAGEGNTFLYVFDRSASMGASGNSLLMSAKRELLASLDDLGEENRFHIIFYNEQPTRMDLGRGFAGLVFADQRAKELARRFIESIIAAGGTRHFEALKDALRLGPDVIFFLTDADEPELSDGQMSQIRSLNGGRSKINTIEFGDRPRPRHNNFLARVARENGGEYLYVDVTRQ
jgi:hypothetical protein